MQAFDIDWPQRGHNYTEEEIAAVAQVMRDTSALSQGKNVHEFEQAFAAYTGTSHAFSTMSCAHALDLAAMLTRIQPGDEVILPAHTYCATALAFARRGAVLRWADIDPHFWTISPTSIEQLLTEKTRVIVVVHLYGLLNPHIVDIVQLARDKEIYVVEDCAQSLGANLSDKHCGAFGDIGCYSFHAQKNLTTLGEGGMLVTRHQQWAEKLPGLRLNGHAAFAQKEEYWLPAMVNVDQDIEGLWPMKSSMNEAQGILGQMLLTRLGTLNKQRRKRSLQFRNVLQNFPELRFQQIPENEEMHSHHLLPAIYDDHCHTRGRSDSLTISKISYQGDYPVLPTESLRPVSEIGVRQS